MLRYSTYRSIYEEQAPEETAREVSLSNSFSNLVKTRIGKLAVVLTIFLMGWTGAFSVFAGGTDKPKSEKLVIVQSGDSLWSIASAHKPKNIDTRSFIATISENNNLNGPDIQAGDVLSLPEW